VRVVEDISDATTGEYAYLSTSLTPTRTVGLRVVLAPVGAAAKRVLLGRQA